MTSSWQSEAVLRELYWEDELTQQEIADELGYGHRTVRRWMDRLNIDLRSRSERRRLDHSKQPASFSLGSYGHERWDNQFGDRQYVVKVHRLLAVAEYGIETLRDKVVHHKNGVPWDNRVENIELMTASEHSALHYPQSEAMCKDPDERWGLDR